MSLHPLQANEAELCHQIRESLRYQAIRELERRRANTFGGLGGLVHRQVCRVGVRVASLEAELRFLCGLLAGAKWTPQRAT